MDIANLSSNWKKLQATIKSDKKPERGLQTSSITKNDPVRHAPPPARQLKRKEAPDTYKSQPGKYTGPKRQKMGAVLSSLQTPSGTTPGSEPSNIPPVPPLENPSINKQGDDIKSSKSPHGLPQGTNQAGKYVSLDCEMVGTHSLTPFSTPAHKQLDSSKPEYSILARVSLVTYSLEPLYDAYVLPPPGVTVSDYRTPYSGITSWHLTPGNAATAPKPFHLVQREVSVLLQSRVLVGHALKNDLAVLGLSHPRRDIRDTARHPPYRALAATVGKDGKMGKGRTPSLKKLSMEVLGWSIQGDETKGHSSVEDAKAAMALFRKEKAGFDKEVMRMYGRSAAMGRTGVGNVVKSGRVPSAGKVVVDADDDDDDDAGGVPEEDDDEEADDNNEGGVAINEEKPKRKRKRKKRTKR